MDIVECRNVDIQANIQVLNLENEDQTNALCPFRSQCLDNICTTYVPILDCRDCPHFSEHENREMLFFDLEGCMKLLWSLFGDAKNPNQSDQKTALQVFDRRDWQLASAPQSHGA